MTFRIGVVVVLAGIACMQASATRASDSPCLDDIQKLCADVPPGRGRVQACLKQHEAEVSAACNKKVDELTAELRTAAAVCRWDIGRLCSDVNPGAGKVLSCLNSREPDLSPECKAGLDQLKK